MITFLKNVWQKDWKGKATLIAGAFIFVGAIVSLIYAISTREGDVGLMKAKNGKSLHWDDVPVACIAHSNVTGEHLAYFDRARKELNTRVGKILISPCSGWMLVDKVFPVKPVEATILLHIGKAPTEEVDGVVVETPWTAHPGGTTMLFSRKDRRDSIYGAMVWIDKAWAKEYSVWLHELGHVLGLDHDRLQDSVMWPKIQERPGKLSNKDVKCIQAAYQK
jgi:hypothetical protein